VLSTVQKVAVTDANILILGENGTGKEVIARAIHRASLRKDEVFISVDLGAISETCLRASLFGYKKGLLPMPRKTVPGRLRPPTRAPFSWMRSAT
jgi:two-component system, NtrC family, response regulator HydG